MKSQNTRITKAIITIICITALLILLNAYLGSSLVNAFQYVFGPTRDYTQYTTPLSLETTNELCQKFQIQNCQDGEKTYVFNLYPAIKSYLLSLPKEKMNLQFVQELIGKYNFEIEEAVQQNKPYYRYWYDFNGDKRFPLVIVFLDNGEIDNIGLGGYGSP